METGPKWYITRGQQRIGPLDASQLRHMAVTEQLGPTEYVWKEGMAQWVQAQQVQGLFDPPPPEENPEAPPEGERAMPDADVSPVIAPYTPPVQQAAAPLIAGSATPIAGGSTSTPSTTPSRPSSPSTTTSTPTSTPSSSSAPSATPASKPTATPGTTTTKPAASAPAATLASSRPASAPVRRAALPAVATVFDPLLPILAGILILATIAIPWYAAAEYRYGPTKLLFSWDMLTRAFETGGPTSVGIWMIGAWVVGLAAIVLAPLTRGAVRGGILAVLGAIAATLLLIVYVKSDAKPPFKSGLSELEGPLAFIAGLLTLVVLVITHLIRRSGPNGALKIAHLIATGALAIIPIILLITAFAASSSLWSQYGGFRVKSPYGGLLKAALLVNHIGTVAAAVMLLTSALLGGRRGVLSGAGLLLLYVIVLIGFVAEIILPAGAFGEWSGLYGGICMALIVIGTFILLGAGLVQLIDSLRRAGAPVIATGVRSVTAGGETVEQKFAKLDQLRKSGVISESEYQQKRGELLKQL